MTNVLAWLTDPTKPGRKRGVAAGLFMFAELTRFAEGLVQRACERALLVGSVCVLHVAQYATWLDVAYQFLDTVLVPGAEITGVLMGLWGLIHARKRAATIAPAR